MFTQRTLTTKLFGYCVNYGFIYPWTVLCTGPGCFNRGLTLAMIAPNCFSAFTGLCALLTLESVLETSVCKRCHGNQASICKHCPNIHIIYIYVNLQRSCVHRAARAAISQIPVRATRALRLPLITWSGILWIIQAAENPICIIYASHGGFHKWEYPKMDGL